MGPVDIQVSRIESLRDSSDSDELAILELKESTSLTEFLSLRLANGTSYALDKADARFPVWKEFLTWQSESALPIYVEAESPSRLVTEVFPVFTRRVESVDSIPIEGRLKVFFRSSPAIYYLNPALPRFRALRKKLESVSGATADLLVTHHPLTFEIIDVRDPPAEETTPTSKPTHFVLEEFSLTSPAITREQAFDLFDFLAQSDIPFFFVADCCTARAQKMCNLLRDHHNIQARKIWNYGHGYDAGGATLYVNTPHVPSGTVRWRYHVAPILRVVDGPDSELVIDPSMFDTPVPIEIWLRSQHDKKATQEFTNANNYGNQPHSSNDELDVTPERVEKDLKGHTGESILLRALHAVFFEPPA